MGEARKLGWGDSTTEENAQDALDYINDAIARATNVKG
jgi:hypothetical protein